MGHTFAKVRISNPVLSSNYLDLELLVDTGSTYTWVDRRSLERIGVKPMTTYRFKTIDNRMVEREIGEAVIECMGERVTTIVVFAREGDAEVLGAYSLEGLRLEVDPVTKQLRKVEALLAL
ncbi:MAG: hypothetical protein QXK12_07670 [Candidatus Nezhaarchaeales archaeon]